MKSIKQQGFTLVELIVVIVILGILAATALPKFIDLSSDARAGVMKGVEASMRGANTMIYGKAAATGQLASAAGSVSATSTINVTTKYGYATDANAVTGLGAVVDLNPASDFTVAAGSIQHAKATTPASCVVTYVAPAAAGGTPTYTSTLTGC